MSEYLDLYDYRRQTAKIYQERRRAFTANEDAEKTLKQFRQSRDDLFGHHPQSALDEKQRQEFQGLHYFPYNPDMRFVVAIDTEVEPVQQKIAMNRTESMTMITMGKVHFTVNEEPATLSIYWLNIYSGGLFLPFRDRSGPQESYGGGRYLFDTIKGSDPLPNPEGRGTQYITLDFNYAYNPSCAHNDRWFCPLAPAENHLKVAIRAGEKRYR